VNADFGIDFVTHDEYKYLSVEVSFRGQRLCQLHRSNFGDMIEIELVEDRLVLASPARLCFSLNDFLEVIQRAREELMALKL
jgi:hypothetical protein